MSFTPATSPLKFLSGSRTEAFAFLCSMQPKDPFEGVIEAYALGAEIPPAVAAKDQNPLPEGPLVPTATCPRTGRTLRLHLFRDLTCLLVREAEAGGFEVLPASLVLPSDLHDARLPQTPFHDRHHLPSLRLQARPDGLRWRATNMILSREEMAGMIGAEMVRVAEAILDAPGVADPRAQDDPPEGGRFAPHAAWPDLPKDRSRFARLTAAIEAAARLRCARTGISIDRIEVRRTLPSEPWKQNNQTHAVICAPHRDFFSLPRPDKVLEKALRRLVQHPGLCPGAALRHGSDGQRLITIQDCTAGRSAHGVLAALAELRDLAPGFDASDLIKESAPQ